MRKNIFIIFAVSSFLITACGNTSSSSKEQSSSISTPSSSEISSSVSSSSSQSEHKEKNVFLIGDKNEQYTYYSAEYGDESLSLRTFIGDESYKLTLLYSFNGPIGLREKTTFKYVIDSSDFESQGFYVYNGSSYVKDVEDLANPIFDDTTDDYSYLYEFYYEDYGITREQALGNFVFYPSFTYNKVDFTPTANVDPYIRDNYSQTWVQVSEDGDLSYDDSFEGHEVKNWTRPSFANGVETHYAASISEYSFEGAMVAAQCAERSGATNIDLHLETIESAGDLTAENIQAICKSISIPVLALAYHGGSATQEHRMECLELAAQNGAAAVDLQGFMGWTGSTLNTQTAENIAYWEDKGFDMCFVEANPVETVLDCDVIEMQTQFVNKIHGYGAEVLMSCHNKAIYTPEQTLAFGKFVKARGIDVLKLVGYGKYKSDLQNCIDAIKLLNDPVNGLGIPFTFHLNSDDTMQISRIICPLIYGGFMAFCYYNQTHLEMMLELNQPGKPGKDATLEEAVEYCRTHTTNSEMNSILEAYSRMKEVPAYKTTAYGASSDMSDRWTVNLEAGTAHMQFRDDAGTNKFSIRGYLNSLSHVGKEFSYTASFTGDAIPFVSSTRKPRVGIFMGTEENMLGFVFNNDAKQFEVVHNDNQKFSYDTTPVGDRLVSRPDLFTPITEDVDVFSFDDDDKINLGVVVTDTDVDLYCSINDLELEKVGSLALKDVGGLIGKDSNNNITVGSIFEIYMGSGSVGSVNWMDISNIEFKKSQKTLPIL